MSKFVKGDRASGESNNNNNQQLITITTKKYKPQKNILNTGNLKNARCSFSVILIVNTNNNNTLQGA